MEFEEGDEETLETLWIETEEKGRMSVMSAELGGVDLSQLLSAGAVRETRGAVTLTGTGKEAAKSVVRRHRLAERLLTDVLGANESVMHERACKFEHLLGRGLDEKICILLGHPRVCPHGKPIPPGECCLKGNDTPDRIVAPLSKLAPGERGSVAYLYAPESDKLNKLMSMGIVPGSRVELIQRYPSFVFQAGQSQFAVDEEIARSIYVRLGGEPADLARAPVAPRRLRRRLGRS